MESRGDLLRRLRDERFPLGEEFRRHELVESLYDLAEECFVTPREIEGMCVLRYGVPFSELSLKQLTDEQQRMAILKAKCDHPANAETFQTYNRPSPYQLGA